MTLQSITDTEAVEVYLTSDDSMCLRRLMEHDVHHPGDLSASQAQAFVVGTAVQWMITTTEWRAATTGRFVLKHEDGTEEAVSWPEIYLKARGDEGPPNTTFPLLKLQTLRPLDMMREVFEEENWMNMPTDRATIIRFALRWRHFCWRHAKDRHNDTHAPVLGIAFEKEGQSHFKPLGFLSPR